MQPDLSCYRFEPDMLAFSGCYYGGGEKEKKELAAIRRRWKTLHVRLNYSLIFSSINLLFHVLDVQNENLKISMDDLSL